METLTFYSYKGGTGRTLLLANAARYLAQLGKRVVALDLDFEAPGLHFKLNVGGSGLRSDDFVPAKGAVDFLLTSLAGDAPPESLADYVLQAPVPAGCEGSISMIPAGAAPSGRYWKSLTALNQHDPFMDPEGQGLAAYLDLKERIATELAADVLLVDSRTGITELSGLATTVLADKVVCLMLSNQENLVGTRAVIRSLRRAARLPGQAPIEVFPVLSRVPDHEPVERVLRFLNKPEDSVEEGLSLTKLFVLHSEPLLDRGEKLHIGSGEPIQHSRLHQDYLELFEVLMPAEPGQAATWKRQEVAGKFREWLDDVEVVAAREVVDGYRHDLAVEYTAFGDLATTKGKLAEAREAYQKAFELRQSLTETDPSNAHHCWSLAQSYSRLGDVAQAEGKLADVRAAFEKTHELIQALANADPSNVQWQRDVAEVRGRLAELALRDNDRTTFNTYRTEALTILDRLEKEGRAEGFAEHARLRAWLTGLGQ